MPLHCLVSLGQIVQIVNAGWLGQLYMQAILCDLYIGLAWADCVCADHVVP